MKAAISPHVQDLLPTDDPPCGALHAYVDISQPLLILVFKFVIVDCSLSGKCIEDIQYVAWARKKRSREDLGIWGLYIRPFQESVAILSLHYESDV